MHTKHGASSGKVAVWNCYWSTPEQAREMAEFRMKQALEEILDIPPH
jgi:hypothetical protein